MAEGNPGTSPIGSWRWDDTGARRRDADEEIRRALGEDEIELLFQPQVMVAGNRIYGVEALARWRHPQLGELGAAPLLETAERAGELAALSRHVHRMAIAAAAGWRGPLAKLRISINVTAIDLAAPGFASELLAAIDEGGLERARVTVEVTETRLVESMGSAADMLSSLRQAGLRIAIDDFGTGYSSLAYLKALPVDELKIDGLLSRDIAGEPRDQVVVRAVLEMARGLGMGVIAEGVETERQLTLLAEAGCAAWQGFLCAPPLDAKSLMALVKVRG